MTENQEKEVLLLLNTIVKEVRGVQSGVKEIKQNVDEHSQMLNRLEAKTDNIAITAMASEKRLDNIENIVLGEIDR